MSPLAKTATLLLEGTIPGQAPEPIAWTNQYGKSRVFYTSLGPSMYRETDDSSLPAAQRGPLGAGHAARAAVGKGA